jgi:hypothetical protein
LRHQAALGDQDHLAAWHPIDEDASQKRNGYHRQQGNEAHHAEPERGPGYLIDQPAFGHDL